MPFTPFHFGPALLIGSIFLSFVDPVSLLVGSVVLDVEPLYILYFRVPLPLHGPFHTYLGAFFMAGIATILLYPIRTIFQTILSQLGLSYKATLKKMFASNLIGTLSHVLLDSFLYPEMNPLLPLLGNNFYGMLPYSMIILICLVSGSVGILLYFFRIIFGLHKKMSSETF